MALTQEQERLLARAVEVYGAPDQWGMVLEECGELVAAINRRNRGRITDDQLLEEVADVIVMVEQARQMLGASRVDRMIAKKLDRLEKRLAARAASFQCPFDEQQCEHPRCLKDTPACQKAAGMREGISVRLNMNLPRGSSTTAGYLWVKAATPDDD